MSEEANDDAPVDAFNAALERHGHALPQAILQAAAVAAGEESEWTPSTWAIEPTEFPVSVQGSDTRIDLLLRHKPSRAALLIGECKRTNPAYSEWCFCRFRWVGPGKFDEYYAQYLHRNQHTQEVVGPVQHLKHLGREAFHLGFEVKGGARGDASPEGQQMEKAFTQVCRGVSGLAETIARYPALLEGREQLKLLPVVFTTARLWTSDVELWKADLSTGNPPPANELKAARWVHFQYPMSPGLMHGLPFGKPPESLSEYVTSASMRTILVVHASVAKDFFQWFNPSHW